jgi:hypothetical protein
VSGLVGRGSGGADQRRLEPVEDPGDAERRDHPLVPARPGHAVDPRRDGVVLTMVPTGALPRGSAALSEDHAKGHPGSRFFLTGRPGSYDILAGARVRHLCSSSCCCSRKTFRGLLLTLLLAAVPLLRGVSVACDNDGDCFLFNPCVTYSCDLTDHTCQSTPKSCEDGDPCTVDSCDD